MKRSIIYFDHDPFAHWRATLECGHLQHMRHDPPMIKRPWVLATEGRSEAIGRELECVLCDELEIPADYAATTCSDLFSAKSAPEALFTAHQLKIGRWAKLIINKGSVVIAFDHPSLGQRTARPSHSVTIPPAVIHTIEVSDDAEFELEYYEQQ